MLCYLNSGERRYGDQPVRPYTRGHLEFEVIVSGRAVPQYAQSVGIHAKSPSLWVHGPESRHGWTDEPGRSSHILVFHFSDVSPILLQVLGPAGSVNVCLSPAELKWTKTTAERAMLELRKPTARTWMWLEAVRAELSLIAMRGLPDARDIESQPWSVLKVEQALQWYREHVTQVPRVEEAARAVGVSPTHLRRLFASVRGESPGQLFRGLRLEAARQQLRMGNEKLEHISAQMGFSEPSAFSRAYRRHFGVSPRRDRGLHA